MYMHMPGWTGGQLFVSIVFSGSALPKCLQAFAVVHGFGRLRFKHIWVISFLAPLSVCVGSSQRGFSKGGLSN